jgi:hypothetical protein
MKERSTSQQASTVRGWKLCQVPGKVGEAQRASDLVQVRRVPPALEQRPAYN